MNWIIILMPILGIVIYIIYDRQDTYKQIERKYNKTIKEIPHACYTCKRLKIYRCNKQGIRFEHYSELNAINECTYYKPSRRSIEIILSNKKKQEIGIKGE